MKSVFRKSLVGLSVFALLVTASCSKRESSSSADTPGASSYTSAQNTLTSLGLAISIPTMGDFADTTGSSSAALTSIFSGNDANTLSFDTTKFASLESAISELQTSLSSYTAAPKARLSSGPNLADNSYKNSDLAYIHFQLGYYYTLHAVLKLRMFVAQGVITVSGNRYKLDTNSAYWNSLSDAGKQAVLDAYFMLNGKRYQIAGSSGMLSSNASLPAGSTRCASYHLDKAIFYAGDVFAQLKTALTKLQTDSFQKFFDELALKAVALGITEI